MGDPLSPVAVGLAVVSVIENLIHAYKATLTFVQNIEHFDDDRKSVINKIEIEKSILIQLWVMLFGNSRKAPGDGLFRELNILGQIGVHRVLVQFSRSIKRYLPLEERYSLSANTSNVVVPTPKVITDMKTTKMDEALQKAKSYMQKATKTIRWSSWGKDDVLKLIDEFEAGNKKLTQVIETHYLLLQARRSALPVVGATLVSSVTSIRIRDALTAQAAMLNLPAPSDSDIGKDLERLWTDLHDVRKIEGFQNFEIGSFEGSTVLVDSKFRGDITVTTPPAATLSTRGGSSLTKAAMDQLVTVLRGRWRAELAIPQCLCWMERSGSASLLFKIPEDLVPEPQSLFDALPESAGSAGPRLESRLALAYHLAAAVDALHSVSYVHKNIRSKNILFYYTKASIANIPSTVSASDEEEELPPKWFLYGFEYSRHMDAGSSLSADGDFARNTYRHPERFGVPTTDFDPIHDIYALGVVLLELGAWRRATEMVRVRGTTPKERQDVRTGLIQRCERHLGFAAGASYRDIVLSCLRSDFGVELRHDVVARQRLGEQFRTLVVDKLRTLAYPYLDAGRPTSQFTWSVGEVQEENPRHDDSESGPPRA